MDHLHLKNIKNTSLIIKKTQELLMDMDKRRSDCLYKDVVIEDLSCKFLEDLKNNLLDVTNTKDKDEAWVRRVRKWNFEKKLDHYLNDGYVAPELEVPSKQNTTRN